MHVSVYVRASSCACLLDYPFLCAFYLIKEEGRRKLRKGESRRGEKKHENVEEQAREEN